MIRNADHICQTIETLKGERGNWETHWQEIYDFIVPRKNDVTHWKSPGVKRNAQVLDNTGQVSCELLAGSLHGMLLNPATTFFELTTGDEALDIKDRVRAWREDTTIRMHNALVNSNFHPEAAEYLLDLCSVNSAGMTCLENPGPKLFDFQTHYIKELFVSENNAGIVDEIYRCFWWPSKKIIQEFGIKNVPDCVKSVFESGKEEQFEIYHAVYPADLFLGKKRKGFRKAIVSQYILVKEKYELRVEGFNEMPWFFSRWSKASGEKYGRGPGMNALPEIKMVNLMEETMIRGAQKTIDPPVQAPDDGFVLPIKTKPGSINFYRSGGNGRDRIEPIFNDARIDFGIQIMDAHRQRIRQAFYVDQLQLGQGPQMTATEVVQRTEEKLKFLGPLLGRLQIEFLAPLIDRVYAIMERRQKFLPPPPELQGKALQVRYSSAIAKMQRMGEVKAIQDYLNLMAPIVQLDPTVRDNFAPDQMARGIANMLSFPQKFLQNQDVVDDTRKARAAADAKQVAQQDATHEAELVNKAVPALTQVQEVAQQAAE
jgi:hypothetical protein